MRLISLGLGVDCAVGNLQFSDFPCAIGNGYLGFMTVNMSFDCSNAGCRVLPSIRAERGRDRVAKQDALDESVRSKTVEVEALQGVVAHLANITSDLVVA
ncbi:hypothetical protein SASPL_108483 [Salvia splendens]|uniref:Uncharacterized protein n=1 Tax=Salvia splendens TaxID=180675 RepID=A0A8X8YGS6_SALSN|nr:hypothetical protein SASPL_108483 [Salvia splendens]